MRVAVVGSGFMGKAHANAYNQLPNVELVGIYTTSKAGNIAGDQFGTTIYKSFEQMILEGKPDLISVCLPTHKHMEYVLKAAKMGVHIICEKPLALTLADSKEMIAACKETNVRLFVGHVLRFSQGYQNISKQVLEGHIGKIGVIHTKRVVGHPGINSSWFNDQNKSGGVIMDLMIHDIDFVCSLNGEVQSVYAMQRKSTGIEYALVTLRFENGVIANLEGLWGHQETLESTLEIYGDKGIIQHDSEKMLSIQSKSIVNSSRSSPVLQDAYYYQLEHFIDCIRENVDPLITVVDAYKAVELSLAAIESIKTRKPIYMTEFVNETIQGGE